MKHLLIFRLWVKIFTWERAPRQKFAYSKSTIETLNSKDTRTTFYCIYCKLWAYFMPFSSVLPVDFEQVNVCWVSPYKFINAEMTYCRNYWQMYKNLSEIEAHKKRVWSKVVAPKNVFPCRLLRLVAGNSSVFFRRALAAINCVYTIYLTGIWKVLS